MYNSPANASSSSSAAAGRQQGMSSSYPILHHHHHLQVQHHPVMIPLPLQPPPSLVASGGDDDELPRRDERFPQWSNQETRDLIGVRAQLEFEFTAAKRNKNLWEMVAVKMREKGYRRTSEQCKCKWKNLVNKYKAQEASDVDNGRVCPFFDELHALFTARANSPNEINIGGRKRDRTPDDISDEDEETEVEQTGRPRTAALRPKPSKEKRPRAAEKEKEKEKEPYTTTPTILDALQEILRNFMTQQQIIDSQWRESMERRAEERDIFEQEWREKMEKLERERMMMEQAWREREEQRRLRDETRAEKRDALLTTLLNKLVANDDKNPFGKCMQKIFNKFYAIV
ncbi:trihelix transcription factor GT-3b-like [Andrographis paniculata]|uniref:trihelix transcription factor GT-3b-like n=1 Tax=Andrographis paniculata TaxID=175694 RepID=UPI0021E95092|nr:trihelix transcription factor GT-3b-like [Andrographis paniculata]